jgi:hypothetical protein
MKPCYLFSVFLLLAVTFLPATAQRYTVADGLISFYSSAPMEDIRAENRKVASLLNVATGEVAFSVPINQFQFRKKLMQEHFNEKYMESDKYPRATFSGRISGFNPSAAGMQQVQANGMLTIHGVTRPLQVTGSMERREDRLFVNSTFKVKLADYAIKIPQLLWQNIAEEVEVTVELWYKPEKP